MNGYQHDEVLGRTNLLKELGEDFIFLFTSGEFDTLDFLATAVTLSIGCEIGEKILGELKNYKNERSWKKHNDYMIDYWKLSGLKADAKFQNRTPLLIVIFTDYIVIWDLTNIDIDSRREWRWVNKDGQNYHKEMEWALETYLYQDEAKWVRKR